MRISLCCATLRGVRFLKKLLGLLPDHAQLTVFSFREEPHEPPFLSEVRQLAGESGASFFEERNIGARKWEDHWKANSIDLLLAVSWRYMIPKHVYEKARLGSYVFHDSLLPRYRGFSPTVWAMINGERETGVTLFEMIEQVDAGPIVDQLAILIRYEDSIATVMEAVTDSYIQLLERNLPALLRGDAPKRIQDESEATYTCKWLPQDALIDWRQPTEVIRNLIRATSKPYPGAFTTYNGQLLRIWEASVWACRSQGRIPGRVVEVVRGKGVVVLTGDGALLLQRVQLDRFNDQCADELPMIKIGVTFCAGIQS